MKTADAEPGFHSSPMESTAVGPHERVDNIINYRKTQVMPFNWKIAECADGRSQRRECIEPPPDGKAVSKHGCGDGVKHDTFTMMPPANSAIGALRHAVRQTTNEPPDHGMFVHTEGGGGLSPCRQCRIAQPELVEIKPHTHGVGGVSSSRQHAWMSPSGLTVSSRLVRSDGRHKSVCLQLRKAPT